MTAPWMTPDDAHRDVVQRRTDRWRHAIRAGAWPWLRVTSEGASHLPSDGPALVVANHTSLFDPVVVGLGSPRALHWLCTESMFRPGPMGRVVHDLGAIPKKRFSADTRAARLAVRWARAGAVVALFPEGERTWLGPQQPFVAGVGALARLIGAPVVPCRIDNGYRHWPRWASGPRIGAVHATFLPPEDPGDDHNLEARLTALLDVDPGGRPDLPAWTASRAKGLPNVVFACSRCETLDSLDARGHRLVCRVCGHTRGVDPLLHLVDADGAFPLAVAVDRLRASRFAQWSDAIGPLLRSPPLVATTGQVDVAGRLVLYRDRVAVESAGRTVIAFPITSIRNANVEFHRNLEIRTDTDELRATLPTGSAPLWPWAIRWAATA